MDTKRKKSLADSWPRSWPIGASTIILTGVSIIGAASLLPSVPRLLNINIEPMQHILFGITALTGVAATMTLNLGIRTAAQERKLEELQEQIENLVNINQKLTDHLERQETAIEYELHDDCSAVWSKLLGPYKGINPNFHNESRWIPHGDQTGYYDHSEAALSIWENRQKSGNIEIAISKGVFTQHSGALSFQNDKYDIPYIMRIVSFFDELAKRDRVDKSQIRMYFSDIPAPDLKSVFLADVENTNGKKRPAMLLYSNSHLPETELDGQVAVFYSSDRISDGRSRWKALTKRAQPWSIDQLRKCFSEFIPKYSGEIIKLPPRDFTFDPTRPFDFQPEKDDVFFDDHLGINNFTYKVASAIKKKSSKKA